MKTEEDVDLIEKITKWCNKDYFITFIASRLESYRNLAEEWLKNHNFNYCGLLMCKTRGGNSQWIKKPFVRAARYNGKFSDLIETKASIQVFEK